jgi:glycine cleavage system H lipoate-binding protein/ABC-type phosphate transport system substrate-binding protein
MKNILTLIFGLSLLIYGHTAISQNRSDESKQAAVIQSGAKTLKITSTAELHNLAVNWANDYNKSDPSLKILIDQVIDSRTQISSQLSFVSEKNAKMVGEQANWKIVVGRDVIVSIFNSRNPQLALINQQGISSDELARLFANSGKKNWSDIIPNGQNAPVNLFMSDDEMIKSGLENFCKTKVSASNGYILGTPSEVIAAVQKDINAIGFCKLNDLRGASQMVGVDNIRLLPIDKNGNGRMDNFEKIYDNHNEFVHGVWIGKYPTALCQSIYAISSAKPTDKEALAFLNWVLADGQKTLNSNGYCDLANMEKESGVAALLGQNNGNVQTGKTTSVPPSWPVYLTVLVLAGIFASVVIYSRRNVQSAPVEQEIQIAPFLIDNAIDVPKGLYFDKTHTWAFMEKDGSVKIGIDDFLQHVTGKLTNIRMKEVGENVRKGEKIMTIARDGKQLNLYAPISGTIKQQNASITKDSTIVHSSPYSEGWVYLIEPKNWLREAQFMLMGEKYADWLRDEFVRLKDFIEASVRTNNLVYAHVVLQDGGELTDNVLADLGPEVWEDFQTRFIDTSR